MITEIFIENRRLDIRSDLSSLLTFAIDDIKDFAKRSTTFSKTIILPGTASNNQTFGNIFEIGISNDYNSLLDNVGYNFNAAKSARCYIFQDNLQTFKGTLRLLEIVNLKGAIEYEVALHGEIAGLNVALSSGLLEDLDFSDYDHTYNHTNIVASWDNPPGTGYYYPHIDHGGYSVGKHDWDIRTFRPALYAKEYLDKMFEAASFRYESDLFNTARFKGLIIPYNRKMLTSFAQFAFTGSGVGDAQPILDVSIGKTMEAITFASFTSSVFDPPDVSGRYYYTGTATATYRVMGTVTGTYTGMGDLHIEEINGDGNVYSEFGTDIPFSYSFDFTKSFSPGDYFVLMIKTYLLDSDASDATATITSASMQMIPQAGAGVEITPGSAVTINDCIPRNIRQVDFLTSLVKLFNLYVYEDQFDPRLIYLKPYVDFYGADPGGSVDWTYKLNRHKPIRSRPMSELTAKKYDFKYKSDSDYYNDLYRKRYSRGYGDNIYDSEFEFAANSNALELIFSATPLVGYLGEDKIFSTIFKQSNSVEETTDYNIRILQTKKITVTSWDMLNGETVLTSLTAYGYAGHLDDPELPANDLNFGVPNELFFDLSAGDLTRTQFNVYWSTYMAEITDKDSRLLIGNFYLTPKDIFSLNFSQYVIVDGVLFRLNKIADYNATRPSDCEVQLLKVVNTDYSFPPPFRGIGDNFLLWNDTDPLINSDSQEILYI